jgi:CcmD family protein
MFYGFLAAWLIVMLYVVSLARRGARLQRELEDVKHLVGSNQAEQQSRIENRIR